ncbi:hypothetical protein UA08_04415 [Talaromyces atroroseus]|uniref:Xylanolytic transcriptional activator regulatory domain-containing protein n=1 Tax=Talaromyces atroroseus TaxID=1441469 RepID=A0A1Q5Q907_TALAT|nr:hypothetical protein UA08_04415 [Talaromyces atroroseus]OKL60618.1 hypothetical protein UA08_04415 [Talaromyces atroroseus]
MSPKRKLLNLDAESFNFPRKSQARNVGACLLPSHMLDTVRQLIDPDFRPEQLGHVASGDDESPRFLKPLPSRMAPEDVDYLRAKGALTVPDTPLRNELLRAYVKWVYSSLPVLDLHSFLEAVATNDADASISLLLFQAVMFAGTAFVDINHLRAAGFKTRREARTAFFNNARLLYVLDCEEDRIAAIQSILLMTYYYEKDESLQKDIWHWVGVCNTQAQSIGLHRDPTQSNMTSDAKSLRIRLWWCLYSRDRLIALALHRPTQINEGFCNVPLLALTDFDTRPFHAAVNDILFDCSYMGDVYFQRRLAVMFIEKVKLCQFLGRVLFAQYVPFNGLTGTTRETTITLIPRQSTDAELQRCSQKLDAWLNKLPDEATFMGPREKRGLSDGDDVLYLHSSMLQMVYHATCTALYRPRASTSSTKSASGTSEMSITVARGKIRDAASETAELAYRLRHLGLTPYLPTYGLTVMTPAAVVHMTNLRSTDPVVRDRSTWNFRLCIEVISGMRDIYPAADYESACLEMAIQQMQQGQQNMPKLPSFVMQDITHRQWGPGFANTTDLNISITEQHSSTFDESTGDEGIAPQRLMIYNDDDDDNNDTNENNENSDDSIEFWTFQPKSTLSPLRDDGGMLITGDLERDLGFI